MSQYAQSAQEKALQGKIRLSHHAQVERSQEIISTNDIIHALKHAKEVEAYPDDPRGPSALLAGQDAQDRWIHMVCANFSQECLLMVTVYIPQPPKWKAPFTRGR